MSELRAPVATALALAAAAVAGCMESSVSYEADVKPIFQRYCQECHVPGGEGYAASGFVVDSYAGVMKGTKFGQVVVPGSAVSSTLYLMVAGKTDPSIRMPHGNEQLSSEMVATIERWIDQGAVNN